VLDANPLVRETLRKIDERVDGLSERLEARDLRAHVNVETDNVHPGMTRHFAQQLHGVRGGHAELRGAMAGGNMR
jgi:hypothetical protein